MAGVRLDPGLREWSAQLRANAGGLRTKAMSVAEHELKDAVKEIKRISPVKTGLFQRSWNVLRLNDYSLQIVDTAPYAEWVHKRGEKGSPFWEAHALPIVEIYAARIRKRFREMLRQSIRVEAMSRLAPTLSAAQAEITRLRGILRAHGIDPNASALAAK